MLLEPELQVEQSASAGEVIAFWLEPSRIAADLALPLRGECLLSAIKWRCVLKPRPATGFLFKTGTQARDRHRNRQNESLQKPCKGMQGAVSADGIEALLLDGRLKFPSLAGGAVSLR